MARLNIEESFWLDIGKVSRGKLSYHEVIGAAVHLFRFAQERYKQGRVVSFEDCKREGFPAAVLEVFAEEVEGGFVIRGSKSQFSWLKSRSEAGLKGGIASGESRRQNSESNKINDLTEAKRSKPKQNAIPEPSYSYSSSISESNTGDKPPAAKPAPAKLPPLVELWNLHRGVFPLVKSVSPKKQAQIKKRLEERPDVEEWKRIFIEAQESNFLRESGWFDFWWLMANEDNHRKAFQGNYRNKGAAPKKHFEHERGESYQKASDEMWAQIEAQGGFDELK